MLEPLERVRLAGLMPAVQIQRAEDIVPTCAALRAGGLDVLEITLRTPAALDAIALATREFPDMVIGAGTVLRPEQADAAHQRGAAFLVTPGCNPTVLSHCADAGLALVPGCGSAGEIEICLEHGFDVVKIFPAEQLGGLRLLRALAGPYPQVRFVPMGGLDPDNLADYARYDRVWACGGSWLATPALIAAGDFAAIERLTEQALLAVFGLRVAALPRDGRPMTLSCADRERFDHYLARREVTLDPAIEINLAG